MRTFILLLMIAAPALSSKILFLSPIHAPSHHMWNTVLATELAERGHHVSYITTHPIKGKVPANMKLSVAGTTPGLWEDFFSDSLTGTPRQVQRALDRVMTKECEEMFDTEVYRDLIGPSNSAKYDLIVMEYCGHDCLLALSYRFGNAPVVITNAVTYNPYWLYRLMGNPLFHVAPHTTERSKRPFDLVKRLQSLFVYLLNDLDYYTLTRPSMDGVIKTYFGDDAPSVGTLTHNIALAVINTPDWINKIPVNSNVKGIAGFHLAEGKPLDNELDDFVNGSENGIILISFGTLVPTQIMATEIFQSIASALGKLPQRVLWKWDAHLQDVNISFPENIRRLPWIPQNDVLSHPKTRLFVSHCGGQSSLEALFHGVPVLAVPGFWDQSGNANSIVAEGAGIRVDFKDITEKLFYETVSELLNNSKYFEGAQRLKSVMRDQPIKPLDHAIFWLEFVIRHKGASHLRPLIWELPHHFTVYADIVIFVIVAGIVVLVPIFLILYFFIKVVALFSCRKRIDKNKVE